MGRLDNLGMSYLSLQALIDSTSQPDALADETAVRAVALFDHEEVGSASAQGTERPGTLRASQLHARSMASMRARTAAMSRLVPKVPLPWNHHEANCECCVPAGNW